MRRRAVLAAVVVALSVGGCSTVTINPERSVAPSTSAPSVSGRPGSTVAPSAAPAGARIIDVTSMGVRVAVPQDWVVLDPKAPVAADFEKVAESTSMDVATIKTTIGLRGGVLVVPPAPKSLMDESIELRWLDSPDLPKAAEVAADLEKMGAGVGESSEVDTPLGPGLRVPYLVEVSGESLASESMVVDAGSRQLAVVTTMTAIPLVEALTNLVMVTVAPFSSPSESLEPTKTP